MSTHLHICVRVVLKCWQTYFFKFFPNLYVSLYFSRHFIWDIINFYVAIDYDLTAQAFLDSVYKFFMLIFWYKTTAVWPIFLTVFAQKFSKGNAAQNNSCYLKQNKKRYLNLHKACQLSTQICSFMSIFGKIADF